MKTTTDDSANFISPDDKAYLIDQFLKMQLAFSASHIDSPFIDYSVWRENIADDNVKATISQFNQRLQVLLTVYRAEEKLSRALWGSYLTIGKEMVKTQFGLLDGNLHLLAQFIDEHPEVARFLIKQFLENTRLIDALKAMDQYRQEIEQLRNNARASAYLDMALGRKIKPIEEIKTNNSEQKTDTTKKPTIKLMMSNGQVEASYEDYEKVIAKLKSTGMIRDECYQSKTSLLQRIALELKKTPLQTHSVFAQNEEAPTPSEAPLITQAPLPSNGVGK